MNGKDVRSSETRRTIMSELSVYELDVHTQNKQSSGCENVTMKGFKVIHSKKFYMLSKNTAPAFLVARPVENLPITQGTRVRFLGQEDLRRRKWQPTPVFLPGESYGQRRLAATVHEVTKSRTQLSD